MLKVYFGVERLFPPLLLGYAYASGVRRRNVGVGGRGGMGEFKPPLNNVSSFSEPLRRSVWVCVSGGHGQNHSNRGNRNFRSIELSPRERNRPSTKLSYFGVKLAFKESVVNKSN